MAKLDHGVSPGFSYDKMMGRQEFEKAKRPHQDKMAKTGKVVSLLALILAGTTAGPHWGFCDAENAGEVIGMKGADRGRLQKVSPRLTCYEYPSLFVVEEGVKDRVGSNILIKHRSYSGETYSCVYEMEEGDFEIRNEWAEYFMGKSGSLIFLDSGTGPCPRGLIVISVEKRKKLYNTPYCGPVAVKEGKELVFWKESGEATRENCPEYDRIRADTLSPYIEERFVLFLETMELKGTGEERCAAGQ